MDELNGFYFRSRRLSTGRFVFHLDFTEALNKIMGADVVEEAYTNIGYGTEATYEHDKDMAERICCEMLREVKEYGGISIQKPIKIKFKNGKEMTLEDSNLYSSIHVGVNKRG